MNYRHAYHAGNFADVFKHIVLTRVLLYMQRKEAALRVIDTHAGIGRYDLSGVEAGKTLEWRSGIEQVLDAKAAGSIPAAVLELITPYLDVIEQENSTVKGSSLRYYPGSPLLTRKLMRAQDRLSALELHPQDFKTLAALFEGDYQTRVTELNGWLALGAHLPPKEKRGVVLVDPPFEIAGEFDRLVEGLMKAHRRFATGTYALWYPVKDRREVNRFIANLKETGLPKILRLELAVRAPSQEPRFDGTGMIIINPPYLLQEEMTKISPWLATLFGENNQGSYKIEWINGEERTKK
ncbi:23S rRNA (adenine2030-N6)-methyltransferase [Pseudochrobactrum saccharolyticum]|uniref:Ribosomal RNA large subunit methyltransferase J n=1 Tax=Pseudochrobactrum saccharolyticum TaxID=354352 RepID=A0A7W8ANZ8_9HYPH|nr:23S rRNA (adenine(2030)-N(6))-methyltransferase RlmJ [Pseudochrobactrum saccharolyticum]KAB0539929.1 23S rRNA (adenine(2030)-N(6))-methyltransferase RlmJ [Pseudochrobactrum saccharolyticum]MBB5092711.1 23S rRNA (adenine2030-N6)-methyltransferase [Pseudochrobactrum saccharolyticum]